MAVGRKLQYEMRRSARARHLRIDVHADGRIVVTRPLRVSGVQARRFVAARRLWIAKALKTLQSARSVLGAPLERRKLSPAQYREARGRAYALVEARIAHFNRIYRVPVGRISIRDQKTRWGSCSQKGNLNFNWRIAHLPPELADYLIVHELCHLSEFNHSPRFWRLVEAAVPDYRRIRRELHALPL